MIENPECRLLTLSDVDQAAQVMAQAYVEDPLVSFMLPNQRTRAKTILTFFRIIGELSIQAGRAYGIGEPLQGVAYWKFPDQGDLSVSIRSIGKLLRLLITPYASGYFRVKPALNQIDALQQKYASEPFFCLDNIGVLPSARGKGLASKLIRPFLDMADARQVVAYTDTESRSNVSLYEHFGFECMEETPVSGTPLTIWALRRSPH